MNWTEIEAKWTAMTRRVQADQSREDDDTVIARVFVQPPLPSEGPNELRTQAPHDRSAA